MSEKEYIERGALSKFVRDVRRKLPKDSKDFFTRDEMLLNFQQYVDWQPAADVEPVVRGEWIFRNCGSYSQTRAFCSACGKHSGIGGIRSNQAKPFCPNCGAHMREKPNE